MVGQLGGQSLLTKALALQLLQQVVAVLQQLHCGSWLPAAACHGLQQHPLVCLVDHDRDCLWERLAPMELSHAARLCQNMTRQPAKNAPSVLHFSARCHHWPSLQAIWEDQDQSWLTAAHLQDLEDRAGRIRHVLGQVLLALQLFFGSQLLDDLTPQL